MDRSTHVSCTHFILYTGLLFSLLLLNPVHCDDVPAGVTVTCYQGTLVTDHTSMVSLDPDSLKGLTRGVCRPPTTTPIPTTPSPTTPSVTTNGTTAAPTNASTTAAPTNVTTATPTAPTTKVPTTATPTASTTKVPTTATTTAPTTKVPTTATTATPPVTAPTTTTTTEAPTAPANETSRQKRAPAEPSTPEYYCHVSFGPTEDTGGKLKFNSTHTMRFYCLEAEETADDCKNNGTKKSVSNDTVTYCCNGDNCNSPMVVIRDTDNKVAVKTIDDCNHYDDKGTERHPCIPEGNVHLCVKQTNKTTKAETRTCAYKSLEQMYCIEDDWYFIGCRNTTKNVTSCCYYPETAPPPSPTSTPVPSSGKKGNAGSIAIAVVVSFVVGTFAGCILLVFLQKKCRRRPGSDGLLDFSYNRFKSAEDTEGL